MFPSSNGEGDRDHREQADIGEVAVPQATSQRHLYFCPDNSSYHGLSFPCHGVTVSLDSS